MLIHLHTCLWRFHATTAELSCCDGAIHVLQSLNYLLSGPSQKNFQTPCLQCRWGLGISCIRLYRITWNWMILPRKLVRLNGDPDTRGVQSLERGESKQRHPERNDREGSWGHRIRAHRVWCHKSQQRKGFNGEVGWLHWMMLRGHNDIINWLRDSCDCQQQLSGECWRWRPSDLSGKVCRKMNKSEYVYATLFISSAVEGSREISGSWWEM